MVAIPGSPMPARCRARSGAPSVWPTRTTSASWSCRRAPRSRCSSRVMRTQHPNLPQLWRGDFSDFAQTMASTWQDVPIPAVGGQDSGNVWLAITRPGQGEALFYGPQRFFGDNLGEAWVAPLDPQSASDWHQLDATGQVHVDLHGLFLSPDFHAGFEGGSVRGDRGHGLAAERRRHRSEYRWRYHLPPGGEHQFTVHGELRGCRGRRTGPIAVAQHR